jgi:hypothetical protein
VVLNSGIDVRPLDRYKFWETSKFEAYSDPYAWSKNSNNLTSAEADLLFSPDASKRLHELTLEALEAGRRFTRPYLALESNGWAYDRATVTISTQSPNALLKFLGCKSLEPVSWAGYHKIEIPWN